MKIGYWFFLERNSITLIKKIFNMKITDVKAIILKLPEISSAADGTQDDLLIVVETDEGIIGYGEVDTSPLVGKAIVDAYMSHGTCYGLREVVVGMDPFDYEQIWNDMWDKSYYYGRFGPVMHVMSGIDMAIWDIMGKATGKPVHKLLGGSYSTKVRPIFTSANCNRRRRKWAKGVCAPYK